MFRPIIGTYKNINDFEKSIKVNNIISSKIYEYRKKIKVLVIDDQDFTPQQNLKQYEYDIDHLTTIPKIDTVKDYHIVLCDLKGVGHNFDSLGEGASLIKHIKKAYPSKFVIAYSGGADQNIIKKAKEYADSFLNKDASIDEWTDKLDHTISQVLNPVHTWKKTRIELLNHITPIELTKLEDKFVRSLLAKDQKSIDSNFNKPEYAAIKEMLNTCCQLVKLYLELSK